MSDELTERDLVAMLSGLYKLRQQRDELDKAYKAGAERVRDFLLTQDDGYQLRDGESGTVAVLQSGGDEKLLDFKGLMDAQEGQLVLLELVSRGLLRLDVTSFQRQAKTMQDGALIEGLIYKVPRTRRLLIDKEDK